MWCGVSNKRYDSALETSTVVAFVVLYSLQLRPFHVGGLVHQTWVGGVGVGRAGQGGAAVASGGHGGDGHGGQTHLHVFVEKCACVIRCSMFMLISVIGSSSVPPYRLRTPARGGGTGIIVGARSVRPVG